MPKVVSTSRVVLTTVRNLVDRLWQQPARARDLAELRRRLAAEVRSRRRATDEERAAAVRLRTLREEIARVQGRLAVCASCTRGFPAPEGIWEGGHCCSGSTADIFRDGEVAALCLAGTRPRHFRAPRTRMAGCAFRGPKGCSLPPRHRANLCSRYLCKEARRELFRRGDLARLESLIAEIEEVFGEFLAARASRLEEEELEEIWPRSK